MVELHDETGLSTAAIGAQVTLATSIDRFVQEVWVTSGYLSGNPTRLHFGLPSHIEHLEIRWIDGEDTRLDNVEANQLIQVYRRLAAIDIPSHHI